jgi:pyridoxal phosphate-dependent aminotransferase EpsN
MGPGELGYVQQAFSSNWLSTVGPNISSLEEDFSRLIGLLSVALSTGTAGIHLGLKILGIAPGAEVVTPTLTFAASCNPVLYERATPIFMDSEASSWNLDPELLSTFLKKRARMNKLPKAVTVVHLFGQSADLDVLSAICARYEIPLLEDAAECLGALYRGRHPGTVGAVGVYSFNGNKIITGTTGGMLVARDPRSVARVRKWSTQARDADPEGISNYVHSELGYNYRMSNVVAGIVRGQLQVLELRVQQRRAVFERYQKGFEHLSGITPQPELQYAAAESPSPPGGESGKSRVDHPRSRHTRWLSCFLIDEREFGMSARDLIRFLDVAGIEARPVWKPMHTQPLYREYSCIGGAVAEDLNRRGICLPSSSSLSEAEQNAVIDAVRAAHLKRVAGTPRT